MRKLLPQPSKTRCQESYTHYTVSVSVRRGRTSSHHLFTTQPIQWEYHAEEVVKELRKRFPAKDGYEVWVDGHVEYSRSKEIR